MSDALPAPPIWVDAAARIIRRLPAGRYRAMNWCGRRGRRPFWAALPPELGGLQYRCDLRDLLMREVCLTGRYEPQETALVRALLSPGMTFVDVGANWGYFALVAAALVGASGKVVAVEADPRACRTLRANVARNRLAHVEVVESAASDAESRLTFAAYGHENDDASNFGVAQVNDAAASHTFEVQARRVDAILDALAVDRVHLLKMDIEGGEARAVTGLAARLGRSRVDRIILELHPDHLRQQGSSSREVVAAIAAHGFGAWRIAHSADDHRRAASASIDPASLLAPLDPAADLGAWPHVLFIRSGLPLLGGRSSNRVH